MSALLQVIGRELRVRALVPAAGIATAITIVIAGWLVADGKRFADVAETSVGFAAFFLAAGGLLLGSLMLARDLEGSRSLLWLARPVGVWTAYAGKFIAAFLLTVVTTILVAVPAFIVNPFMLRDPAVFAGALLFAVACIALGASLGLLLRNRSIWFIPAAAILVGFGAGMWANAEGFLVARGIWVADGLISVAVGTLVVALVAAHGVAWAHGRYDARAQARQFTLVLLVVLGSVLAVSTAFGAWLRGLDLDDFSDLHQAGGSGDSVVVHGYREKPVQWNRAFVVDLARGATTALPPGTWDVATSKGRAYYATPNGFTRRSFEIFALEPGAKAGVRKTGVTIQHDLGILRASDDGSRFAVTGPDGTAVYDAAGKSLGSFKRLSDDASSWRGGWAMPVFTGRDTLRLYEMLDGKIAIRDADLRARKIVERGTVPGSIYGLFPAANQLVIHGEAERKLNAIAPLALHDGATGAKVFEFPKDSVGAVPLSDGTWAAVHRGKERSALIHVDASGRIVAESPVANNARWMVGEVRPGVVAMREAKRDARTRHRMNLVFLDVNTGRVIGRVENVTSARSHWQGRLYAAPGSRALRVITVGNELHEIDPGTLSAKKIAVR